MVVGNPVAAMVCQATCVSDATLNPHVCCHHAADSTDLAVTCATGTCDHANEAVTTAAVVTPVVTAPAIVTSPFAIGDVQRTTVAPLGPFDFTPSRGGTSVRPLRI